MSHPRSRVKARVPLGSLVKRGLRFSRTKYFPIAFTSKADRGAGSDVSNTAVKPPAIRWCFNFVVPGVASTEKKPGAAVFEVPFIRQQQD